jgi:acetyltransferase-like isoleucine patch superfamily enzyme
VIGRRSLTAPLQRQVEAWVAARPAPDPSVFARFGAGSWIVPPTTVEGAAAIEVGEGVVVMEEGHLTTSGGGRLVLGDRVRLAPFASVHATIEVVIEADVSSSDHVAVVDRWGPPGSDGPPGGPVRIGAGAYLGCSSVVGPGVTVGAGAFVGEGAVVLDDVPAHAVVYGNPARVVARYDADRGTWAGRTIAGTGGRR